mgnify:FL=1
MSEILVLDTKLEAERKAKQVPDPSGYHLLCMIPKIEDTYGDSAIIKADETVKTEEQTTVILFVAKVGPDAYKDANKFPTGPWCKQGDFVLVRPYTGTRVLIHGTEWRLINDDSVQAVVQDPRGIRRA